MSKGRYGIHGGQYIPETLMHEIENLEKHTSITKTTRTFAPSWTP